MRVAIHPTTAPSSLNGETQSRNNEALSLNDEAPISNNAIRRRIGRPQTDAQAGSGRASIGHPIARDPISRAPRNCSLETPAILPASSPPPPGPAPRP